MKEYNLRNSNYKIRYHDFAGDETPILFIHGLGCAGSYDYPNVASNQELSKNRRILIDLLGAGYSDKPTDFNYSVYNHAIYLSEFLEDIGITKFILFGHSLGGAIALSLANLCRDKVSNIILSEANLDSGGGFISKIIASYELGQFIDIGFNKIIDENRKSSNQTWVASLCLWLPKAVQQVSKSLVEGQKPSWREIFYSLKCPKTFIYGEKSLPDTDMDILISNGINIEIVKNAGHSMSWENPLGLAQAIKKNIIV